MMPLVTPLLVISVVVVNLNCFPLEPLTSTSGAKLSAPTESYMLPNDSFSIETNSQFYQDEFSEVEYDVETYDENSSKDSDADRQYEGAVSCYEHCRCVRYVIKCVKNDTIRSLGRITYAESFLEIIIENQPNFFRLKRADLTQFTNLQSLSIRKSSLQWIEEDAFSENRRLEIMDLQYNKLSTFSWRLLRNSKIRPPYLQYNPLVCNCTIAFLRKFQFQNETNDITEELTCVDEEGKSHSYTDFLGFEKCVLPSVILDQAQTITNATDVEITCHGEPKDDPNLKVNWHPMIEKAGVSMKVISKSAVELIIRTEGARSSGSYACSAENESGRDEKSWNLFVLSSPSITELTSENHHPTWIVSYEVTGYPPPSLTWFKENKPWMPENHKGDINHVIYSDEDVTSERYIVSGRLVFEMPLHTYNGNYSLVASNPYGSHNRTVSLNIMDPSGFPFGNSEAAAFPAVLRPLDQERDATQADIQKDVSTSTLRVIVILAVSIIITTIIIAAFIVTRKFRKQKSSKGRDVHHREWKNGKSQSDKISGQRHSKGECDPGKVRKNSLARLCLNGGQGGRPACRENIPLSCEHVVENPNYEKNDGSIGGGLLIGGSGGSFVHERYLFGMSKAPKIPRDKIECMEELGEGAFGLVYLGLLDTYDQQTEEPIRVPVAIKTVKECQLDNNRRDFDMEASMLSSLRHENIVTFHGVSVDRQPHMIVLEYMEFGDLSNFLRTNGPDGEILTPKISFPVVAKRFTDHPLGPLDLLDIAVQIARGAAYLAGQHFVHRDLATRNCLVGAGLVVKIGDFGMSRDIYATDYYKVGSQLLMPVRWMPPESILYRKFTVESDVWSFGVVMWEIYTYAKQPWYELSNIEVIQQVQLGSVMTCPSSCPNEIYGLMLKCWHKNPHQRIAMDKTYKQLNNFLQQFKLQQQQQHLLQRKQQQNDRLTSPREQHDSLLLFEKHSQQQQKLQTPSYLELFN